MARFSDSLPTFMPFSQRAPNELSVVNIDHNYSKPWSSHPEASNARPLHMLFMEPFPRQACSDSENSKNESEIINVDGDDNVSMPLYDVSRARTLMSDCERHAVLLHPQSAEMKDDWEDHIALIRTTWTVVQNRIFAKVMRVLQADRLARLTIQETQNEPIQRRLQIDKAAKRVRYTFANINWDMPVILWLHNIFLEKLKGQLLVSYLEILQTLKDKIPSLIDCLIEGTVFKPGGLTQASLSVLMKRTWDPVISSINQQKPKKLPGSPLLMVVSDVPSAVNSLATKRYKFWQHQLSSMGKVVNVVPVNNSTNIPVANCVENMIASTRSKILEMKGHFPGRVIVLLGFHVGALIATQVALMEQINAVVCLGFPTVGINGTRGDIDEPIYNTKTPTLFVVGQHANCCNIDTLEDIREKLRVDTGLVVVGGADNQLRMSRAKKKSCGVTQCLVDRCIIDEVIDFLGSTLSQAVSQPEPVEEVDPVKKSRKRKLKEKAIAVGSQTSDIVKQQFIKALKSPKQDPLLSSVSANGPNTQMSEASHAALSTSSQVKERKKTSPKKRPKSSNKAVSGKRPLLHLNIPTSKPRMHPSSLSNVKEAAAIASAPELSNLLQNMKPTIPQSFISSKISLSTPSTPTVSTLPLAAKDKSHQGVLNEATPKSSASSGFLKTDDDPMLSQSTVSNLTHGNEDNTGKTLLPAKQLLSSVDNSSDIIKQPTQIQIQSGPSSQPLSIPLSFTMANKVLKSMSNLTRHATSSDNVTSQNDSIKSSKMLSPAISQMTQASSTSLTTYSASKPTSTFSLKAVKPSESQTPLASVISIGSDTVQMKETPPSITSAPGTVSIDLGQLASSSNIVMKFGGATSKISLMPTLKQGLSSVASSLDKVQVQSTSASNISTDNYSKASPTSFSAAMKTTSILSSSKAQINLSTSHLVSKSGESPLRSSGKSLTLLAGSQLKSTLTNPGFITLKLTPPATSSINNADTKTSNYKTISSLSTETVGTNTHQNLLTSGSESLSSSKIVLSSMGDKGSDLKEVTAVSETKSLGSTSLLPITLKPSSKIATGVSSSVGTSPPITYSRKIIIGSGVETLGQVSSLLESSPVTLGHESKTPALNVTQGKEKNEAIITQAGPTGSTCSSSQGQTSTPRASKSTISSYTSLSKPVLPTVASTRTRRIKTPKQYDL